MGKTSESIIKLDSSFEELNDALIESGGEITPEIQGMFDHLDLAQERAADNMQQLIAWNKSEDAFLDAEIKRLQARKKAKKNAVERLKNWLLQVMLSRQITKIKTTFCTVSVCAGRDSVGCDEDFVTGRYIDAVREAVEDILPEYVTVELKVDKTAAMDCIQNGRPVPTHMEGQVELPDIYITRKPYLLIK